LAWKLKAFNIGGKENGPVGQEKTAIFFWGHTGNNITYYLGTLKGRGWVPTGDRNTTRGPMVCFCHIVKWGRVGKWELFQKKGKDPETRGTVCREHNVFVVLAQVVGRGFKGAQGSWYSVAKDLALTKPHIQREVGFERGDCGTGINYREKALMSCEKKGGGTKCTQRVAKGSSS